MERKTKTTLPHPPKSAFGKRMETRSAFKLLVVDAMQEYMDEAEHQDGYGYWDNFSTPEEAFQDFLLYLNTRSTK